MFTLEQILSAHSKIKSGPDFPRFIKEIGELGVARYETFVKDGHTDYYDSLANTISSRPRYSELDISGAPDHDTFRSRLLLHQRGQASYPQFCSDAASSGVFKWIVNLAGMTCTYIDALGHIILTEEIPEV